MGVVSVGSCLIESYVITDIATHYAHEHKAYAKSK